MLARILQAQLAARGSVPDLNTVLPEYLKETKVETHEEIVKRMLLKQKAQERAKQRKANKTKPNDK